MLDLHGSDPAAPLQYLHLVQQTALLPQGVLDLARQEHLSRVPSYLQRLAGAKPKAGTRCQEVRPDSRWSCRAAYSKTSPLLLPLTTPRNHS